MKFDLIQIDYGIAYVENIGQVMALFLHVEQLVIL